MKVVERYILEEFFKLLTIALLAFILLFLLVDLFENMDNLVKHEVPLLSGAAFFAYKIPFIIGQVSPISVLMAALLSLGIFSKHNEITAMKAGGIKLAFALRPLLAAGLLISVVVIMLNETVTPSALRRIDSFKTQWFGVQGGTFGQEGLWVRTQNGIFNIRQVGKGMTSVRGVTLYEIEKPFKIKRRVYSRALDWKDGSWVAKSATVMDFHPGGAVSREERMNMSVEGLVKPEELANAENLQKNMGFMELKNYIDGLEQDGYDSGRYRIDLYGKITFPLVNFLMVLVGIPFALKTGRHGGIAAGIGLSIAIAFSYWVVFAITRSLGQSGILPPFVAAGFPDLLFLATGVLSLSYLKQ